MIDLRLGEDLQPSLRVLDLFSGIGGFSLGLERAGFETVAFCECEPYARRILRQHWPAVPLFEDVRTLTARRLRKEGIEPNVICGGFPCQDISTAGKGKGIEGERSGLWKEMFRLVKEVRPAWVIAENVPALRTRGADTVLADLEGAGYAAWPLVVGAVAVGALHRRERVWIVANAGGDRSGTIEQAMGTEETRKGCKGDQASIPVVRRREALADAARPFDDDLQCRRHAIASDGVPSLGYSNGFSAKQCQPGRLGFDPASPAGEAGRRSSGQWEIEPAVGRVADGIPDRVDRLRCLGNSVVPQVVELIGRAILAHHAVSAAPDEVA